MLPPHLWPLATRAFSAIRGGRRIDRVLERELERHPLASGDRAALVSRLRRMAQHDAWIRAAVGERPEEILWASEVLDGVADRPWPELGERAAAIARDPDLLRRLTVRHGWPRALAEAVIADRGAEAPALAEALDAPPPITLRANTLRTTRDALIASLAQEGRAAEPTRYARAGLTLREGTPFDTAAFQRGELEMQDEGSQLIAELVAPPPRGTVVDFCAGSGGKTLALSALLENRGRVVALDVSERKLSELRRRARRAGASNVRALAIEAEGALPAELASLEGAVDRVLVDAPCSGAGVLRRNPELRFRFDEAHFERLPSIQLAIAERAAALLAPGGRLIYATCTMVPAENEAVVSALLARRPELGRVPLAELYGSGWAKPLARADGMALELSPERHGTDAFFAAVLRRTRRRSAE